MRGTTQEVTRKTVQKTTQEDVGTARGRRERLREQTDRKIMKATLGIVISDGIGAVTIEEVARRSGVAKTTIYRRYRNADDLLQRIQPEVAGLPNFNDLKPSRNGLATMLQRIQDCFDSELGLKAVGVVLSSDNATLKAIAAQVLAPAEERFVGFMERGIAECFKTVWTTRSCSARCWVPCWLAKRWRGRKPEGNGNPARNASLIPGPRTWPRCSGRTYAPNPHGNHRKTVRTDARRACRVGFRRNGLLD